MVIQIGPKYQWHFTSESDRAWLEETLKDSPNYNANLAIALNDNLNETLPRFKFSRIFSDILTSTRILWVAQTINHGKINTISGAIHPSLRGQGYVRDIGNEDIEWFDRENRWSLSKITFGTGEEFSAGTELFPDKDFQECTSTGDGMRSSIRRING